MAEPDPNYTKLCEGMKALAAGEAESVATTAFTAEPLLVLDAVDLTPEATRTALDRETLNQEYRKKIDETGATPAELHAMQMQVALLSGLEKAKNLRYRSRVTSMILGANKPYGQSRDTGFYGLVLPTIPLQQGA